MAQNQETALCGETTLFAVIAHPNFQQDYFQPACFSWGFVYAAAIGETVSMQADARTAFVAWAAHFGKEYSSSGEFDKKLAVWQENVASQLTSQAVTEVNGLADMTTSEFKAAYLGQVSRFNGVEMLG